MRAERLPLMAARLFAGSLGLWAVACAASEEPTYTPNSTSGTSGGTATGVGGPSAGPLTGSGTTSPGATTGSAAGVTGGATASAVTGAAASGTTAATTTTTTANGIGGAAATNVAVTGTTADTATSTTGAVEEDLCLTRPTLTDPGISDFDAYTGEVPAEEFGFTLFDDGAVQRYAGVYENSDTTGTPEFGMASGSGSGAGPGDWAVRAANASATQWGGGVGIWINCVNASSFTGLSLAVRGSTPAMSASVSLTIGETGSVSTAIEITDTFAVHQLPFSMFTNDEEGATVTSTNGDNLTGITIGASMIYEDDGSGTYMPVPGPYEVIVDDLTFY